MEDGWGFVYKSASDRFLWSLSGCVCMMCLNGRRIGSAVSDKPQEEGQEAVAALRSRMEVGADGLPVPLTMQDLQKFAVRGGCWMD